MDRRIVWIIHQKKYDDLSPFLAYATVLRETGTSIALTDMHILQGNKGSLWMGSGEFFRKSMVTVDFISPDKIHDELRNRINYYKAIASTMKELDKQVDVIEKKEE